MSAFEFKLAHTNMHDTFQHFRFLTSTSISLAMTASSSIFFILAVLISICASVRLLQKPPARRLEIPLYFSDYGDVHECKHNEGNIVANFSLDSLDLQGQRYDVTLQFRCTCPCLQRETYPHTDNLPRTVRIGFLLDTGAEKRIVVSTQTIESNLTEQHVYLTTIAFGTKEETFSGLVALALDDRGETCSMDVPVVSILLEREMGLVSTLLACLFN
ncbi:uncharacterized protein FOMMEDRAFT_143033 [Fomitiporia mediterranea MF3/22]|uniref:uncharacterized protein n=1 Tax=Fomitiporia mediterranea (strain MF3/22) TaxID=694068 RepID=UPI0004408B74|nr:uncharacterized protein FOMMEDRAFT_143033 [Fomitiporia mediterranea MF3/22]EJC98559.1 hypothetical protein FOMMEDRAFT_143033 [Fomitiporia mediterranea MF3/22]